MTVSRPPQQTQKLIELYNDGKLEEALQFGESLTLQSPDSSQIQNILGLVNASLGRFEQAVERFSTAVQIDPNYTEAHFRLGNALFSRGNPEAAIKSYATAIEINAGHAEVHNNLGLALTALGQHDDAVDSFNKATEISPGFAEAHNNLGNALRSLGKPEAASISYRRALEIAPGFAEAHNNLGIVLNNLGQDEEAIASYNRALELRPDYVQAHRNLSTVKTYDELDSQARQMLQLVERQDLSDEQRIHLNFALGKALGDIGGVDEAFAHLAEGNRLRKAQLGYDTARARESFEKITSVFTGAVPTLTGIPEAERTTGHRPIFIVGMPRSGTTLVEQILASHSQVCGAGELTLMIRALGITELGPTGLSADTLQAIREFYLSGLATIGTGEPYVADKNPLNFRWIGFIVAAIPEARIIHVKRDARATCWSNYKHYFSAGAIDFAYDIRDVAEYYKMYAGLMDFWHEAYPGRIHDLRYETLTESQEIETRKLLDYLGLGWEEQCLEFHKTERAVQTASDAQVRQALYQGSSDQWRNYEKHLQPMIELLNGL